MKYHILMMLRQYRRKPITNLINLLGLALGMTVVSILAAYCYSELTTDSHHEKGDQIFMVLGERSKTASIFSAIQTPGVLKKHIEQQIPNIKTVVRIAETWDPPIFQVENREPLISSMIFVDSEFFDLFIYSVLAGNIQTALKDPLSMILVKSEAERLFGTDNAIGKTVKVNNQHLMKVTAIIDAPRNNSCFSFNAIAPVSSMNILQYEEKIFTSWQRLNFQTFVLIENEKQAIVTQEAITNLFPLNPYNNESTNAKLIPFNNIYFSKFNNLQTRYLQTGNKSQIMILLFVAIFVLFIAIINFINISSAQRLEKLKQYGVRKIIGASRYTIVKNIIIESIITFVLAVALANVITAVLSPFIKNFSNINFSENILSSPLFIIGSFIGAILLSIITSAIPAIILASSHPLNNLNKILTTKENKSTSQKILVVSQFVIAIVLIAFTLIVQKQVDFGSKNLGFNKENIIAIKLTNQLRGKKDVLKKYLLEQASVQKVSFSRFYPGKDFSSWKAPLLIEGKEQNVTFNNFHSDAEFFDLMGIELVRGRFFTNDLASDKNKVLVNEAFLREHNILDPIGRTFYNGEFEIIGVVKDFHYKPVNEAIGPMAIICREWASECLVKLNTDNFNSVHQFLENTEKYCAELSPAFPVEINFMDTAVESMYKKEVQFRRTFSLFAGCALFLCCLGIFALSLFASQRRIKEIGIRKVLGAKPYEILILLNKSLFKWVGVAFIIACPIAWYIMNNWLQNFAYRTELSWWIFILAGTIVMTLALMTVSFQAIRAARANPVESLRYE